MAPTAVPTIHTLLVWLAFGQTAADTYIFWTEPASKRIRRLDVGSGTVVTVVECTGSPSSVAVDSGEGKIVWFEDGVDGIWHAGVDGTGVKRIISGVVQVTTLAIDTQNSMLYWSEATGGALFSSAALKRSALDGTGVEVIESWFIGSPQGMVADPQESKLLWTDSYTEDVRFVTFDGSSRGELGLGTSTRTGLAIDMTGRKLYWANAGTNTIQRSNLDGSSLEEVTSSSVSSPTGVAVVLDDSEVYWANSASSDIQRASMDGSSSPVTVLSSLNSPSALAAYEFTTTTVSTSTTTQTSTTTRTVTTATSTTMTMTTATETSITVTATTTSTTSATSATTTTSATSTSTSTSTLTSTSTSTVTSTSAWTSSTMTLTVTATGTATTTLGVTTTTTATFTHSATATAIATTTLGVTTTATSTYTATATATATTTATTVTPAPGAGEGGGAGAGVGTGADTTLADTATATATATATTTATTAFLQTTTTTSATTRTTIIATTTATATATITASTATASTTTSTGMQPVPAPAPVPTSPADITQTDANTSANLSAFAYTSSTSSTSTSTTTAAAGTATATTTALSATYNSSNSNSSTTETDIDSDADAAAGGSIGSNTTNTTDTDSRTTTTAISAQPNPETNTTDTDSQTTTTALATQPNSETNTTDTVSDSPTTTTALAGNTTDPGSTSKAPGTNDTEMDTDTAADADANATSTVVVLGSGSTSTTPATASSSSNASGVTSTTAGNYSWDNESADLLTPETTGSPHPAAGPSVSAGDNSSLDHEDPTASHGNLSLSSTTSPSAGGDALNSSNSSAETASTSLLGLLPCQHRARGSGLPRWLRGSMAFVAEGLTASEVDFSARMALAAFFCVPEEDVLVESVVGPSAGRRLLGAWLVTYRLRLFDGELEEAQGLAASLSEDSKPFESLHLPWLQATVPSDVGAALPPSYRVTDFGGLVSLLQTTTTGQQDAVGPLLTDGGPSLARMGMVVGSPLVLALLAMVIVSLRHSHSKHAKTVVVASPTGAETAGESVPIRHSGTGLHVEALGAWGPQDGGAPQQSGPERVRARARVSRTLRVVDVADELFFGQTAADTAARGGSTASGLLELDERLRRQLKRGLGMSTEMEVEDVDSDMPWAEASRSSRMSETPSLSMNRNANKISREFRDTRAQPPGALSLEDIDDADFG